jgi:hypothetical protein
MKVDEIIRFIKRVKGETVALVEDYGHVGEQMLKDIKSEL